MGILDKIMFWRKKDEFSDLGLEDKSPFPKGNMAFGDDFGMGQQGQGFGQSQGFPPQPSSFPQSPSFQQPAFQPRYEPRQETNTREMELVSAKLDALRASLDSISQRLANLEAIARGEEEKGRRRYY